MSTSPIIDAFFDESTFTITYLVSDPVQRRAAIIDPVLDYDHRSGTISTHSADRVLARRPSGTCRSTWCWRPTPMLTI